MFDYTCHLCRKLHGFVRQVMPNHKDTLACFLVPMPLDAECNKQLKSTSPSHVNGCEYAKICLAVQQVAPEKYDAFDQWLFSEHETAKPLELVRNHAEKLVGKEALGQALVSATLQTQLQRNIEIYELNFKKLEQLQHAADIHQESGDLRPAAHGQDSRGSPQEGVRPQVAGCDCLLGQAAVASLMRWIAREHQFNFPRPTIVMGIVNTTPDLIRRRWPVS